MQPSREGREPPPLADEGRDIQQAMYLGRPIDFAEHPSLLFIQTSLRLGAPLSTSCANSRSCRNGTIAASSHFDTPGTLVVDRIFHILSGTSGNPLR